MNGVKRISFSLLVNMIVLAAAAACAPAQAASSALIRIQIESRNREEAVLAVLRARLPAMGNAGRVYYDGECTLEPELAVQFPHMRLRAPAADKMGLEALRDAFGDAKSTSVTRDASGMLRVIVGDIQSEVLRTHITRLHFTPLEQYNPGLAIGALVGSPEAQAVLEAHKIVLPLEYSDGLVTPPRPGLPHLPPSVVGVTVDRALDMIASTFGGVVLYGTCAQPSALTIRFAPVVGYRRANRP